MPFATYVATDKDIVGASQGRTRTHRHTLAQNKKNTHTRKTGATGARTSARSDLNALTTLLQLQSGIFHSQWQFFIRSPNRLGGEEDAN
eukprot:3251880-Amphidinium_carterae.1